VFTFGKTLSRLEIFNDGVGLKTEGLFNKRIYILRRSENSSKGLGHEIELNDKN
jgi:hypothetical protein